MNLNQYFTPTWAAELLVQRFFPALTGKDVVLDPSCGDGRFLIAVPAHIHAYGVEIDAAMADAARANTGRTVIEGDFLQVALPVPPTVVVGNPPFVASMIDQFLQKLHAVMEYGGRAGLILPAYYFQTAGHVIRLSRSWSIAQTMLPRNLFEGLAKPLVFATFTKEHKTTLSGFFLYGEVDALDSLRQEFKALFVGNGAKAGVWREAVYVALRICGGRATLQQLYQCIESKRPTDNPFWREKIRQIASKHFTRINQGEYALQEAA